MGNSDRVGGGIGPSSWGLRGRYPQECRCAKRPYLHAPVPQAFWPRLCQKVLHWAIRDKTGVDIPRCISNTKVSSRFTKLKHAITVLNKASRNHNNMWGRRPLLRKVQGRLDVNQWGSRNRFRMTREEPLLQQHQLIERRRHLQLVDIRYHRSGQENH